METVFLQQQGKNVETINKWFFLFLFFTDGQILSWLYPRMHWEQGQKRPVTLVYLQL